MPLFDYLSDCGRRFERLVPSWRTPNPVCPHCGAPTHRLPGNVALVGNAAVPAGDERAPTSWEGTSGGNRKYVAHWRQKLERRQDFEAKNPEHATRRDAIAAHEGVFEGNPLTYRELASRASDSGDAVQAAAAASQARTAPTASGPATE